MSFFDAFLEYHHIQMHSIDSNKIMFIIGEELCFYKIIPFGLKNVGAIYQKVGEPSIQGLKKDLEVFVDNLLVKSKSST